VAIIGEAALSAEYRRYLEFADQFEQRFVHQGMVNRDIVETFDIAWDLLSTMPDTELKRIRPDYIQKYYRGQSAVNSQQ